MKKKTQPPIDLSTSPFHQGFHLYGNSALTTQIDAKAAAEAQGLELWPDGGFGLKNPTPTGRVIARKKNVDS